VAAPPAPDDRANETLEQLEAILSNKYLHLFVASEMFGLLLAVITGPSGSASAPLSGFTGSLSQPRIWTFLGVGAALFAVRTGWGLWGPDIKALVRSLIELVARFLAHVSPRLLLELGLTGAGFVWVTWITPHDTWKGGVCIQIGATLLVLELVVWLFQDVGVRWARLVAYAGLAGYGALAWMSGTASRYLDRIGAVPHNHVLGRLVMVLAGLLAVGELLFIPITAVIRRVAPHGGRKIAAMVGIGLVVYGWLQWTSWSQWSASTPHSFARWLSTQHLLVHDHTSGLAVMLAGALLDGAALVWMLGEFVRSARRPGAAGVSPAMGVRRVGRVTFGRPAIFVVILLIVLQWPLHMDPGSQSNIDTQIMPLVLLALGLNVVIGFAGLLDLGYVAFYAIGAYLTGYFTGALPIQPPFFLNPFWTIPFAIVAAMLAGVLLGTPTLRLRGDYLAIVTLGFGEIVYIYALGLDNITGGAQGAPGQVPSFSFNLVTPWWRASETWSAISYIPSYYLILGAVLLSMLVFHFLNRSKVGRSWAALREDETAADSLGVNALKYRVMAFAIGASTGGFAGVFLASQTGSLFPSSFIIDISITVVVCVVFGGMGSLSGAVLGAIVVGGLPAYLQQHSYSWYNPQDLYIYLGALLVIMMIFRPQGLIPSKQRRREIELVEAGLGPMGSERGGLFGFSGLNRQGPVSAADR
jgi:branched-chain amino acid transport system permease protein